MNPEAALRELEETYDRMSCLLDTLGLMVLGLMQAKDPYASGFNALWCCLADVNQEIKNCLSVCQSDK